jgi:hypothetical protein
VRGMCGVDRHAVAMARQFGYEETPTHEAESGHTTPVARTEPSARVNTKTVTSGPGCLGAGVGAGPFPVISIGPGCVPSPYLLIEVTAA